MEFIMPIRGSMTLSKDSPTASIRMPDNTGSTMPTRRSTRFVQWSASSPVSFFSTDYRLPLRSPARSILP